MAESHVLANATNVSIKDSHFHTNAIQTHYQPELRTPLKGLDFLFNKSAPSARVDSNARYDAPRCDEGTREAIIQRIMEWIESDEDWASALWLHGPAGSGKSALARTIAELCAAKRILMATFFFARIRTDRIIDGNLLIPTLAYQLAEQMRLPRASIKRCLLQDRSIFHKTRELQMKGLVINPLSTYLSHLEYRYKRLIQKGPPQLIVIDGLDECLGKDIQRDLVRVLGQAVQTLRLPIRFLVASRPESQIREMFVTQGVFDAVRLTTFDLGKDPNTTNDIRTYLEVQFTKIRNTHTIRDEIPASWPSREDIATLVERASGQFIFVSTVAGYLGSSKQNPVKRLNIIIERLSPPAPDRPYSQLDLLYQLIFSSAEESGVDIYAVLRVLGILIVARPEGALDGLYSTYAGIAGILSITSGDVVLLLDEFVSLIELPPLQSTLPIRILHASLADFLLDGSRSGRFYVDVHQIHGVLVSHYSKKIHHLSEMTPATHRDSLKHFFLPLLMHWRDADMLKEHGDLHSVMSRISEAMVFLCECPESCEDVLWTMYQKAISTHQLRISTGMLEQHAQIAPRQPVIVTISLRSPPSVWGSLDSQLFPSRTITRRIGKRGPEMSLIRAVDFRGVSTVAGKDEIIVIEISLASPVRCEAVLEWLKRLEKARIIFSGVLFHEDITSKLGVVEPAGIYVQFFRHCLSLCPVAIILEKCQHGLLPIPGRESPDADQLLMPWTRAAQGHQCLLWCLRTWQTAGEILVSILLESRMWGQSYQHGFDDQNTFPTLREINIDIRTYLEIQFAAIQDAHRLREEIPAVWPSPEDITILVERISNQLIASTAIAYIGSPKHNPVIRLTTLLEHLPLAATDAVGRQFDSLYRLVFSSAEESGIDVKEILLVMGVLIVERPEGAPNDLYSTYSGIAGVLKISPGNVVLYLKELAAFIELPPHESMLPITIIHAASLADFLLDPARAGRFYVDMGPIHEALALHYQEQTHARISKMSCSTHCADLKQYFFPLIFHCRKTGISELNHHFWGSISFLSTAVIMLCQCPEPCYDLVEEKLIENDPVSPMLPEWIEHCTKQHFAILSVTATSSLPPYIWNTIDSPYSLHTRTRRIGTNTPEMSRIRSVTFEGVKSAICSKLIGEDEIIVIEIPSLLPGRCAAMLDWLKGLQKRQIQICGVLFCQNPTSEPDESYQELLRYFHTICPVALLWPRVAPHKLPKEDSVEKALTIWRQATLIHGTLLWCKYQGTEESACQILLDMLLENNNWSQNNYQHSAWKEIGIVKGRSP
ncbi:unnamed protein product [Cyclocybe aegerita]|uniref:NACHT domain-containing protein n=1 Tax=Cyclocybe aegerita TaxID=1973307 RepID=A0A8S0W3V0_CYCAE|nr:unnamed protein product [Cyclocybe aegerita]